MELSFVPGALSGTNFDTEVMTCSITTITFRSIKETGQLVVDVDTAAPKVQAIARITETSLLTSIPGIGPALADLVRKLTAGKDFENIIAQSVHDKAMDVADVKSHIQSALNGQGRFIFPGGGTFDMKDPIFNNAGDLMIGLTYRKGEA